MLRPYRLKEVEKLNYQFETDQGIIYTAYFLDYSTVFFDYGQLVDNIYSFNIDLIQGNTKNTLADSRIADTVVEIMKLFFETNDNVAIYICDSLDNRQLARKRKFDRWFWKYNDGRIIKEDQLAVVDGVSIYNTLLIRKDHQQAALFIEAFRELNARDHDNK
ncbi:DUF6169 family protein [Parapedobacter sp. 2B3]|uniref:DUF6169 family protein n=1 Tax=Parapedobacter sp. 2B3 TaxID=3342381 RepID=UPI0035B5BFFF